MTTRQPWSRAYTIALPLTGSPVPQFKDTLGWINYLRGDYTAATPLLEDAVKALPNIAIDHYHLGMVYIAVGENVKALAELKKASELAPNDSEFNAKIQAAITIASKAKNQTN